MPFLVNLTLHDLREEDASRANTHDLVGLASYGSPSSPRYAAIWRAIPEPIDSTPIPPLPRQIVQFWRPDEPFVAKGPLVSPILFSMTGSVSGDVGVTTTVVYEEHKSKGTVPKKISFVAAESERDFHKEVSYRSEPLAVDAVWYRPEAGAEPQFRVAGLFRKEAAKAVWGLYFTPAEVVDAQLRFAPSFMAASRSFKRAHFAVPSPETKALKRQVVVLMRGDAYVPWRGKLAGPTVDPDDPFGPYEGGTLIDGPIPPSAAGSSKWLREGQGLIPIAVSANGSNSKARLCITWAPSPNPLPREVALIDGAESGPPRLGYSSSRHTFPAAHSELNYDAATQETLDSMKDWVRAEMAEKSISNAQVAIAHRGRLKLLWSFTRGETGWPLTQPTSKFRVASSIKIVTAALAVTLGESFLKRTLPEALGVTYANVAPAYPPDSDAIQKWTWFAQTTIEDCLQHLSCFTLEQRDGWAEVFDKGRQQLPLSSGDFTLALQQGALRKLVVRAPRTYEEYNNWGYVAVGEAISRELQNGNTGRFLRVLKDWIAQDLGDNIDFIPKTREDSLDQGEVPVRSRTCARRNTEVPRKSLNAADVPLPPFAPGGYDFDDYDLWGPTGGLTMSLATYVRLLQMLHPEEAASDLTGPRLRIDQVFRMLQRYPDTVPNEFSDGVPKSTSFGLGAKVGLGRSPFNFSWGKPKRRSTRAPEPDWELTWGGDLSSAQSAFAHFVFPRPDGTDFLTNPDSLTVAWITNNGQRLGSFVENLMVGELRAGAIAIQKDGGWDNDVDLFPALDLL